MISFFFTYIFSSEYKIFECNIKYIYQQKRKSPFIIVLNNEKNNFRLQNEAA